MEIFKYGTLLNIEYVQFNDSGKYDQKIRPGIVLLPTTHEADYTPCLFLTTSEKIVKNKPTQFHKLPRKRGLKNCYIGLSQIIDRKVELNKSIRDDYYIHDDEFFDLLQDFYNYQSNLETPNDSFLQIKHKISTMISLNELNKEFDINTNISAQDLDYYSSITDPTKLRTIYILNLLKHHKTNTIKEKDLRYYTKLLELYNSTSTLLPEKINLEDPNNSLRQLYFNFRNSNYFINTQKIFSDLHTVLEHDKQIMAPTVDDFLKKLEEETRKKEQKKLERIQQIAEKKKYKKTTNSKQRSNYLTSKYGRSDWY